MKVKQDKIASSATAKELVVFSILRESRCKDCNKELWKGNFLFMDADRPLCLSCSDLDHLIYLPKGDAALDPPRQEVPPSFRSGSPFQQIAWPVRVPGHFDFGSSARAG